MKARDEGQERDAVEGGIGVYPSRSPRSRRAWLALGRLAGHPWVSGAIDSALLLLALAALASGMPRDRGVLLLFFCVPILYRLHVRISTALPRDRRTARIVEQVCILALVAALGAALLWPR